MAETEAQGLFGNDAAAPTATERRKMLKRWDHVSVQVLQPQGKSEVHEMGLATLWKKTAHGNKASCHHSNLASEESYREGVGWSQTAESLLAAIDEIKEADPKNPKKLFNKLLKHELFLKAHQEAVQLEPFLRRINAGKGSEKATEAEGFGATRERQRAHDGDAPTDAELREAVGKLRTFLQDGMNSPLRGLLSVVSSGGVFYQAAVADKVARAAVAHKVGMTLETMTIAVQGRHKVTGAADAEDKETDIAFGIFK